MAPLLGELVDLVPGNVLCETLPIDQRRLYLPFTVFLANCTGVFPLLLLGVTATACLAGRPLFFGTTTDNAEGGSGLVEVTLAGLPRFLGVVFSAAAEVGVVFGSLVDRRRVRSYRGSPTEARFGRPVDDRLGSSASGMMETSPNRAFFSGADDFVLAPAFLFFAGIVKRSTRRCSQR